MFQLLAMLLKLGGSQSFDGSCLGSAVGPSCAQHLFCLLACPLGSVHGGSPDHAETQHQHRSQRMGCKANAVLKPRSGIYAASAEHGRVCSTQYAARSQTVTDSQVCGHEGHRHVVLGSRTGPSSMRRTGELRAQRSPVRTSNPAT